MSDLVGTSIPEFPQFRSNVSAPHYVLPPGSWDTAAHVYGPLERYPLKPGPKRFSPPPAATLPALTTLPRRSRHRSGSPCSAYELWLRSPGSGRLSALCQGRYVGVALVDEASPTSNWLICTRWRARRQVQPRHGWSNQMLISEARKQADRVADLGGARHTPIDSEVLLAREAELATIEGQVCIDHIAHLSPASPDYAAGLAALGRLLERPNFWLRLSNADRVRG